MPEERPDNQPDSGESTPASSEPEQPVESKEPANPAEASDSSQPGDATSSTGAADEAGPQLQGEAPEENDAASAALKAAREALASIQAEADAAMTSKPAAPPPPPATSDPVGDLMGNDDIQAAFAEAEQQAAASEASPAPPAPPPNAKRLELPDFDLSSVQGVQHGLDLLADVQLDVRIELGRSRMLVEDVLRLNAGAVVELDRLAGDPLDVYVNDRLVARGEVLVLNDNFCIRINEIVDSIGEEATQTSAD